MDNPPPPPPGRNKPVLPAGAPAPTGSKPPSPPSAAVPPPAPPAPVPAAAPAATSVAPESPAPAPEATPAKEPAVPPNFGTKMVSLYNKLFPPETPQRRYGPAVIGALVLVVLLLGKCAVSSVGEKVSEISSARAEEKRVRTTGILVVKSNRPEAAVEANRLPSADDASTANAKGALEQPLPNLLPGKYAVTLHADGWPDARAEVEVPAGRQTDVTINFKSGALRLDSDPTGATVTRGGATLGKTPLVIPQLPPGENPLSLEYPTWPAVAVKVVIKENQENAETIRLPHGRLTVESTPAGATVLVGGRAFGQTPLLFENFPAGPRKLTLQAKDFPALEIAVALEDRADVKVSRELGAAFPELDPALLLRAVWVPTDPNQIAPRVDSTGIYEPRNGVVKNLNRKRLYESWLRKTYRFTATVKAYDAKSGKVEFAEQENAYAKYRILAELSPEARVDKDLAAKLAAKGATIQLYGRLTATEEPRWPSKVITFELSNAELLH